MGLVQKQRRALQTLVVVLLGYCTTQTTWMLRSIQWSMAIASSEETSAAVACSTLSSSNTKTAMEKKLTTSSMRQFQYRVDADDKTNWSHDAQGLSFAGVLARSWNRRKEPIPCLPPRGRNRFHDKHDDELEGEGLVFIKPLKTGSSTAAGINLRIAWNQVNRSHHGDDHPSNVWHCRARYNHQFAHSIFHPNEDDHQQQEKQRRRRTFINKQNTFLWSIVRDPTSRIVSYFFHFYVSRYKHEPSDVEFIRFVTGNDNIGHDKRDHYMHWLSTNKVTQEAHNPSSPDGASDNNNLGSNEQIAPPDNPVDVLNQIMAEYDFIGVTERMDESAVALAMLMNIPLADVLYLTAKGHGGFDDGGFKKRCTYIVPSFVSPGMSSFFNSTEFQDLVQWDHVLHQAVNASLDLTIKMELGGRKAFDKELARYRHALKVGKEKCLPKTVFPCSAVDGRRVPDSETDCLHSDFGCGHNCLNKIAKKLNLWEPPA